MVGKFPSTNDEKWRVMAQRNGCSLVRSEQSQQLVPQSSSQQQCPPSEEIDVESGDQFSEVHAHFELPATRTLDPKFIIDKFRGIPKTSEEASTARIRFYSATRTRKPLDAAKLTQLPVDEAFFACVEYMNRELSRPVRRSGDHSSKKISSLVLVFDVYIIRRWQDDVLEADHWKLPENELNRLDMVTLAGGFTTSKAPQPLHMHIRRFARFMLMQIVGDEQFLQCYSVTENSPRLYFHLPPDLVIATRKLLMKATKLGAHASCEITVDDLESYLDVAIRANWQNRCQNTRVKKTGKTVDAATETCTVELLDGDAVHVGSNVNVGC